MKEYVVEIAICTIVAVVVTLLFYVMGMDHTWQDAANTFGVTFLVMFVLGLYQRLKRNKK